MKTSRILAGAAAIAGAALLIFLGLTRLETVLPALNAFLMIGLGLGLGLVLKHRFGLLWGLYGAGALTFILSQVGHIPFNAYALNPLIGKIAPQPTPGSADLAVWGVLLGLSAGMFEETARYLVLRFWRRDVQTWPRSLMFGAGHGGIEAIVIGILAFVAFFQLVFYRQFDPQTISGLSEGPQLDALQLTIQMYWDYNWYEYLWGSLERFSVLPIHLSATVLVYNAVRRKNILWYLAAVLWHALVDFFAVFASQTWSIALTEGILFVLGLFGWGIVFLLRERAPKKPAPEKLEQVIEPPVAAVTPADKSITTKDLEESRYE